jgi:hypothetical protein
MRTSLRVTVIRASSIATFISRSATFEKPGQLSRNA